MGEGYQVNAEALAQAGQQVSAEQSQADSLLSTAQGMNVDTKSWGLLGMATTYSKYASLQSQLVDHLGKVGNGVGAIGANLTSTAEGYLEAEATNSKALQQCMPDSGGDPTAGGSGGGVPSPPSPPSVPSGGTGVQLPPDDLPAGGGGVEPDWPTGGPDEQIETV